MADWARRGFLRGTMGVLAFGTGGSLLGREADAAPPAIRKWTLLIDGAAAGTVFAVHAGLDGAQIQPAVLSFSFGTGLSRGMYEWIQAGPDGKTRRSGALVDAASGERLEFTNAQLTEIGMPALDAKGKDPAFITVKARPELTRRAPGPRLKPTLAQPAAKTWLPSNFHLKIDGLEDSCVHVSKIDALTIKQTPVRDSLVTQWEHPARSSVETPDLVLTLAESHAAGFADWHDNFLAQKASGRAGTLAYLAGDGTTELFTLTFTAIRPLGLTPERVESGAEQVRRIKVEMYCEEIRFSYTPAATFG